MCALQNYVTKMTEQAQHGCTQLFEGGVG
jgi:hypothetical protein